jgi:hypothetical protein
MLWRITLNYRPVWECTRYSADVLRLVKSMNTRGYNAANANTDKMPKMAARVRKVVALFTACSL